MMSANLRAFLATLRQCEVNTVGQDGYGIIVGGERFTDFTDHPNVIRSGTFADGTPWRSSAAGAYQFLHSTWLECKHELGLPDFGPDSQDKAAVFLINRRGALSAVEAGDIDKAIALCNKEWASLPGSPYGQPRKSLEECRRLFKLAGGIIANESRTPEPEVGSTPSQPADAPPGSAPITERIKDMVSPFVIPILATVIESIPSLMRAFKGDSKIVERNARVVELVSDTIKTVTGEASVLAAAEKVLSDPATNKQADMAFQAIYFDLIEVGGGIEAARKVDAEFRASGDSVWRSPSFIIACMLLPLVYIGMVSVALKLPIFPDWPVEVRIGIINTVIGMIIGGLMGYYFGMMTSRNRAVAIKQ